MPVELLPFPPSYCVGTSAAIPPPCALRSRSQLALSFSVGAYRFVTDETLWRPIWYDDFSEYDNVS